MSRNDPDPIDPTPTDPNLRLEDILGTESGARRRRTGRWVLVIVAALAIVGVALAVSRVGRDSSGPRYTTEPASVGTLVVRVSATGNLQPTNQVEIGSELSGIVTEVLVDENERVTAGQVLLGLDTSRLEASVSNARALLAVARAEVDQAEANAAEAEAMLERLEELHRLSDGRLPSGTELDAARAARRRAEANVTAARANVTQARASLRSEETNLDKATIRSPIDGVVLVRAVEPGQTVAATLHAPVLFTIAEDLRRMELRVAVDEADVGRIDVGQRGAFSVDTWPDRSYEGVVVRVGLAAEATNDVVSYPAVLAVSNEDLSLRPGMTATAEIVTLVREDVLLVPNAALRFDPHAGRQRTSPGRTGVERLLPGAPSRTGAPEPIDEADSGRVWVASDGHAVPVELELGPTDGRYTEVLSGDLAPGAPVITERARGSS